ncbi:MAG TPA: aminotransferase class I/II-fold pyridoxal phosphate-dependent enzyme [Acidimicrobiia bacterium]|nr:aminotransferase class I/II-fold pyridoxal phosphate-dependent enzyme [Acidimicrobiia bacterium]
MREVSSAIRGMARSGIREVYDMASSMTDVIHLEFGEPNFDTPAHVCDAAALAAARGFTKYTPNAGIPELREALAVKVRERNHLEVEPSQVIVTVGAVAGLFSTMLVLCEPGDEVLVTDPSWPNYRMIARLQGLAARSFPLLPEHRMEPRAELIEPLITKRTRVIVLNSPSNPTGTVIGREALGELIDLARHYDIWILSDEVYDEITFERPMTSIASLDPDGRVFTVFSFSKTYAMTGWRVGYVVAPPQLAGFVVKTQEPLTACVNAPAQMAALAALTGPQDIVAEMCAAYRERRDRVLSTLEAAEIPTMRPDGAFYVWADVSKTGMTTEGFTRRLISERRVAVVPGSAFGPQSDSHVRLSLAADPANLYEALERITDAYTLWSN